MSETRADVYEVDWHRRVLLAHIVSPWDCPICGKDNTAHFDGEINQRRSTYHDTKCWNCDHDVTIVIPWRFV